MPPRRPAPPPPRFAHSAPAAPARPACVQAKPVQAKPAGGHPAPPPVVWGGQPIQAKPAAPGAASRHVHAPPPTRFGQAAQAKGAPPPGKPPPGKPFGPAGPVQAKSFFQARPFVQAKPAPLVVQCAFTAAGRAARARVCAVTGENPNFDSFDGNTFGDWSPAGNRIGFNTAIRNYVINNAPNDGGINPWITCAYCNFEYPRERIQVDHVTDWRTHSLNMTTAGTLDAARAWEVYIGCNDPANLIAACDSCNASKGDNPATAVWVAARRALALAQGGF